MYTRCIYCIWTSTKLPPKWQCWLRHNDMMRVGLGRKHILSAKGESPNLPKGNASLHRKPTPDVLALGRVWSGLSNVVWTYLHMICHQRFTVCSCVYIYLPVYVWVHVYSIPRCIPYGYNSRYGSHSYSYSCSYGSFYLSPYSYVIILCWRCITCFPPWASCQDTVVVLWERQPKGFTNLIESVSPHHSHSQECLAAQYAAPARRVLKW